MTSMPEQVAAIVADLGRATIDDILERFPQCSRKQVSSALSNGSVRGLVECVSQDNRGGRLGRAPGVWQIPGARPAMKTKPARSVFELGSQA